MSHEHIPHFVDSHVGMRLRTARTACGISQTDLGRAVGVSFQQIQKYENGFNRLSASRLFLISQVVGRPIEWFFEGIQKSGDRPENCEAEQVVLRPVERETVIALRELPRTCQQHFTQLIRELAGRR